MNTILDTLSDTVWFTPIFFVLLAITALAWELSHRRGSVGAGGRSPRPPGESLRHNMESLNDALLVRLLLTLAVAVVTGIVARSLPNQNNIALLHAILFTGSCLALGLTLWTWRIIRSWRSSHLGFETERMVGRQLNLLMLEGCHVFHDLVDKEIGNLDHIIVAPHAVFVVETMTVRNRSGDSESQDQRVVYTGGELRFPNSSTNKPLKKAARNAKWLRKYISRMAQLQITVYPVLALPGCSIDRVGTGEVIVVNPTEIGGVVIDRAATPLYDAQRQHVINLLNARCQVAPF